MKHNLLLNTAQRIDAWLRDNVANISADAMLWVGAVLLHSATLPSLLAVMSGLSADLPPVDMVVLVWAGLVAMFFQAVIQRNYLLMITISLGFAAQCVLLALIFFPP